MIIQAGFKPSSEVLIGESPFLSTAKQIITANNHINTTNIELWKHQNALMLINQEALSDANSRIDTKGNYSLKTIPDGSALIWSGEKEPSYLTRDLGVIEPAISMYNLYMDAAIDNEKSAKSVSKSGYDGSDVVKSGLALIVERDPIMANIVMTALDCEKIHQNILIMADLMINDGVEKTNVVVEYDKKYDMTPFKTTLENVKIMLNEIRIPSDTFNKQLFKKVVSSEVKDTVTKQKCNEEIEAADMGEKIISDFDLENQLTGE
jgi:hypothetical protein